MAIPCLVNMNPANDDVNLRRLERLLFELFLVLRELLAPGMNPAASTYHPGGPHPPPPPPPSNQGGSSGQGRSSPGSRPLTRAPQPSPRRTRGPSFDPASCKSPLDSWQQLGGELRDIADTLGTRRHHVTQVTPAKTLGTLSMMATMYRLVFGDSGEPPLD